VTPAGRFAAEVFAKGRGRSTVWVDYDVGIALHKMPIKKTSQRRDSVGDRAHLRQTEYVAR